MEKAIFIYNPRSGPGSIARKLDYIVGRFLQRDILLQPFRIGGKEQDRLPSVLSGGEYSRIIVAGGDGTINYMVNVMQKNNINLPMGIVPSGTCNDFARSLNIPLDMRESLETILDGNTSCVDVGLINGNKFFLNTCAGGNLVDASFNTSNELKRNLGPLAYYIKALIELPGIKPLRLRVKTDDEVLEQEFLFFLIVNGRHAGGFSNVIPEADIEDGMMDMLFLTNCLHIDLPTLFFKVLGNDYLKDERVIWLRSRACLIEGPEEVPVSVDGEEGRGLPMSIQFINRALRVFVK